MYFAIASLAVVMGMTTFYKNTRYVLIVLPFLALAGSFFCVRSVDWFHSHLRCRPSNPRLPIICVVLTFILLSPTAIYAAHSWKEPQYVLVGLLFAAGTLGLVWTWILYRREHPLLERWAKTGATTIIIALLFALPLSYLWSRMQGGLAREFWSLSRIQQSDLSKTAEKPGYAAEADSAAAIERIVPSGQHILTFEESLYYYAKKNYVVSEYDRRMMKFYQAASFMEAEKVLHELGLSYFYVKYTYTPSISHPYLEHILLDASRISVVHQDATSFLLEVHATPKITKLGQVMDIGFSHGLQLEQHHWHTYPVVLGQCSWFSASVKGIWGWYKLQFGGPPFTPACATWYDDRNWMRINNRATDYRLVVRTSGRGCLHVTVFFRRRKGATLGAAYYAFTSTRPEGIAIHYFRPPPDADGVAIALSRGCQAEELRVTGIRLDEIIRAE
jgi:hypothetical protein